MDLIWCKKHQKSSVENRLRTGYLSEKLSPENTISFACNPIPLSSSWPRGEGKPVHAACWGTSAQTQVGCAWGWLAGASVSYWSLGLPIVGPYTHTLFLLDTTISLLIIFPLVKKPTEHLEFTTKPSVFAAKLLCHPWNSTKVDVGAVILARARMIIGWRRQHNLLRVWPVLVNQTPDHLLGRMVKIKTVQPHCASAPFRRCHWIFLAHGRLSDVVPSSCVDAGAAIGHVY